MSATFFAKVEPACLLAYRRDYFLASFVENSALHCGVFKENVDE
jgi:hypothetical protein